MFALPIVKTSVSTRMPGQFVLELRNVSSLTEARFAAGEGFTHIRLDAALAGGDLAPIEGIKGFLSGILVGLDLEAGQSKPDWADYFVQYGKLLDSTEEYSLVPPASEGDLAYSIIEIEDLSIELPKAQPAGLSIPSPTEYKVGHADYEPVQDLLEKARDTFGL